MNSLFTFRQINELYSLIDIDRTLQELTAQDTNILNISDSYYCVNIVMFIIQWITFSVCRDRIISFRSVQHLFRIMNGQIARTGGSVLKLFIRIATAYLYDPETRRVVVLITIKLTNSSVELSLERKQREI